MIFMNHSGTKGSFKVLKLKQGAQEQITDYLREEIYSGNLKPGVRLPPTQELAAQWETHAATVHKAMEPLVKEGLLARKPRSGTFVCDTRGEADLRGNLWRLRSGQCPTLALCAGHAPGVTGRIAEGGNRRGFMDGPAPPRVNSANRGSPWSRRRSNGGFKPSLASRRIWICWRWQRKLPVPTRISGSISLGSKQCGS